MANRIFHVYAIISIILWGFSTVLTRLLLDSFSVTGLACLRLVITSLFFLIFAIKNNIAFPISKNFPLYLLAGITGFFLFNILVNQGISLTTLPSNSIVIVTWPIYVTVILSFLLHDPIGWKRWIAICIQLIGIILRTVNNQIYSIDQGMVFLILATFLQVIYNLILAKIISTDSARQATIFSMLIGAILMCVVFPQSFVEFISAPTTKILLLIVYCVFCTFVPFLLWAKAFELAKNFSSVSNYMLLSPVFTTIFSVLFLNETVGVRSISGLLLILGGTVLFNSDYLLIKKI